MKTFIVAEIASNWEGSLQKARKLIIQSKKAGADAVKFQMWRASDLYTPKHPEWEKIKRSEITFEKAKKIKKIADKVGIEFFCSAFYPEAVSLLEEIGVKRYKIASRTCLLKDQFSRETLEAKAKTRKPIIISMGMGGNKKRIQSIFSKNKKIFCYCISEYPLKFSKINWKIAEKFDGFSDHTMDITAPILFATIKKQKNVKSIFIEKHVKLKESKGPDTSSSIDVSKLAEMITHIRRIENSKTL